MCLVLGLYVVISFAVGTPEIGLLIQPFLNIGLGYFVAHSRNCQYRRADVLQIIMATGTVLIIASSLALAMPAVMGLLIGFVNALISVVYIPYRLYQIFPKGGRAENPGFLEDVKNIIDERKKGM